MGRAVGRRHGMERRERGGSWAGFYLRENRRIVERWAEMKKLIDGS